MPVHHPPPDRRDFTIAIICALRIESDAILAMFDDIWEYTYRKEANDPNTYTVGRIGIHNVVLTHLPGIGKTCAASAAASLRSSFHGIRLGLLVGVCGGVPIHVDDEKSEILLGDLIISTGIVQYDFGRQFPNRIARKESKNDSLSRPSTEIRSFLQKIGGLYGRDKLHVGTRLYLTELRKKRGFERLEYPGESEDKLYESEYRHKHQDSGVCPICARCESIHDDTCDEALVLSCSQLKCDETRLVARERLIRGDVQERTQIHFGDVASGDLVIKSAYHRDMISQKEKVIAFEMEAAGVWEHFPTVVIKGVCDYADSHKNKIWQGYAAAVAAACMKAFLGEWIAGDEPQQVERDPGQHTISKPFSGMLSEFQFPSWYSFLPFFTLQPNPSLRSSQLQRWSLLIQSWCRHHQMYGLSVIEALDTPLFHNSTLRRGLTLNDAREIIDWMVEGKEGKTAEWIDGENKTMAWIWWMGTARFNGPKKIGP
ncbi:nucleoside phosphorylase domain-containing protein [Talaromyces proteolyticus]|uniref:Vacuolar protein-sorting-associated protein 25 n=1 Tax=Talaromyces proteolyticus TaxID=1131652 RepID=A0AAD4L1R8_9EURO|nr:nucleoside phosphorylase domain-containing protein [Talaromyces proteolyticus]KAH8702521.1 nucleoside phosphorylase domain-containing protein [Talaromyces proteolyticus]